MSLKDTAKNEQMSASRVAAPGQRTVTGCPMHGSVAEEGGQVGGSSGPLSMCGYGAELRSGVITEWWVAPRGQPALQGRVSTGLKVLIGQ